MNEADAFEVLSLSLRIVASAAGPIVAVTLIVGTLVALLQALTQIQEMTLTFVPKLVGVMAVTIFSAGYVGAQMQAFTERLMGWVERGF